MTVCCWPSTSLTCRIRAAKARASASRLASLSGGEQFDASCPPCDLGAREALEILLHPVGRVAGETVLPACEPQEHQMQVVAPRIPDDAVQHAEVELPFLRFDLVPGNARQDGVEFGLDEPGPYRLHVLEAGGAAVVQFPGQSQERLAIDDQLGGRALLLQVRDVGGRGRPVCGPERRRGPESTRERSKTNSRVS